ncbi:hypothetical protein BUALT_Bualt02G0005200 [Buddleja alternifolia]|uniref:SAM domain-containing protein n=1 Tax=Buddleja alternifolia TaxID=168488 RepID=A0AAV6Y2S6_9LAMI|nr:hypothetical protein BUALT_Bualt02G0005200 [Buddleja alternifolia]
MYADQVEGQSNRSIKDRLDGNSASDSGRRRPIAGKRSQHLCFSSPGENEAPFILANSIFSCRQREDDKWEHDLFQDNESQVSNSRVGARDLRLKLQRKNIEHVRGSVSGGARDLREKLSGTFYSRPDESKPPPMRTKPATEVSRPPWKSVTAEAPVTDRKVASSVSKKKVQQKVESVDNFLQSLDLEKYSITLQAEEVDMAALIHMSDEDLKALGIPMGPRKKILLALESKSYD